ncbi:hypothetical protein D3C71_2101320 [compost metagenome]
MDVQASSPAPLMAKTVSITTEPASRVPIWAAASDTRGRRALRSAYFSTTLAPPSPMARAVRM